MLKFAPLVVSTTLTSSASRAAVWHALETAPRWPEVLPDVVDVTVTPAGRLEPGAVIVARALPGRDVIDMSYRVLAAEPLRRLVLMSSARGFRAETEYVLEDDGDGSEITLTARVMAERMLGRVSMTIWRNQHEGHIAAALRRRGQAMLTLAAQL